MKGGGGALVRERLVADAAARFLVLVDEPKLVASLDEWGGCRWRSCRSAAARAAHELADLSPRRRPGRSDDGLVILDLQVPAGSDWGGSRRARPPRPAWWTRACSRSELARVLVGRPDGTWGPAGA